MNTHHLQPFLFGTILLFNLIPSFAEAQKTVPIDRCQKETHLIHAYQQWQASRKQPVNELAILDALKEAPVLPNHTDPEQKALYIRQAYRAWYLQLKSRCL